METISQEQLEEAYQEIISLHGGIRVQIADAAMKFLVKTKYIITSGEFFDDLCSVKEITNFFSLNKTYDLSMCTQTLKSYKDTAPYEIQIGISWVTAFLIFSNPANVAKLRLFASENYNQIVKLFPIATSLAVRLWK
jgi:hypothetical protein